MTTLKDKYHFIFYIYFTEKEADIFQRLVDLPKIWLQVNMSTKLFFFFYLALISSLLIDKGHMR